MTLPEASNIIPCLNGLLDRRTLTLHPHTPNFFNLFRLPFHWDPDAECPVWRAFLDSILSPEQKQLLQEYMAYCLLPTCHLQKMLCIIGPPRAGKGTIAGVFWNLIGAENCCAPLLSTLGGNFALESFLNKRMAIVADAHIGKAGRASVEKLLAITGEDPITVARKNRLSLETRLPVKFLLCANALPDVADGAGALAARMMVIDLKKSFVGREDPTLSKRLQGEMPGILSWALEALPRLEKNGFTKVQSGWHELFKSNANPVETFLGDYCDLGEGYSVPCKEVFARWVQYCDEAGIEPGSSTAFGMSLKTAHPEIDRVRSGGGNREYVYQGIRLARVSLDDFKNSRFGQVDD